MAFDDTDRIGFGRKVYDYFTSKGLAPHQAAAIAGNMAWEGGGRADLVNPNDNIRNSPASPHSFGVGQWNDRLPRLVNFARSNGINIPQGDLRDVNYVRSIAPMIPLNTQLDFAWDDMNGPEGRAFNAIRSSPDLRTATGGAISYHRPAGWTWNNPEAGHAFPQRMALGGQILSSAQTPIDSAGYTRSAYDKLADSFGPGTPTAATTGSKTMATPLPQSGVAVNAPQGMSPEQVAYNRRLAMELIGQAGSTARLDSPWQVAAQVAKGLYGGYQDAQASKGETQGRQSFNDALKAELASGTPNAAALARLTANPWASPMVGQLAGHALSSQWDQETPAAKLALEAKQFALENSKQNAPLERQKTEAEIKALGTKDAEKEAAAGVLRGIMQEQGASPANPAITPGYQPMPPGGPRLQPQSSEVAPGDPNLIKTQAAVVPPAPAAQPDQDTVSAFGKKIPREKARQYGEALLAIPGKEALGKHLIELAGQGAGTLSKPGQHDIDKAELGFTNMSAAFKEIKRLYDPKFLQGSPKIQYAVNNFRDKWAPDTWAKMKLSPQETQDLAKYEKFGAAAMNNVNTRLKELSGTAVTATEMDRILKELPSPGTSPFSGDGPTAFMAKLEQGQRMTNMGIARMRYLRTKGFTGDVAEASSMMPLESMPSFIQQRGDQYQKMIEQQMPGADPNAIKIKVKSALAKEFGTDI